MRWRDESGIIEMIVKSSLVSFCETSRVFALVLSAGKTLSLDLEVSVFLPLMTWGSEVTSTNVAEYLPVPHAFCPTLPCFSTKNYLFVHLLVYSSPTLPARVWAPRAGLCLDLLQTLN